ncbi:MAG: aspartyl-phosphate phosphatase Spo0E family protein [Syntrophomonas sp.]|jgi:hypothetical protein|uniref:aspartyl-phosphate phosphatase Spo0E family protein n=1 Tax=Syntrophomonas wolfei TaxID=863 RepID=UPI000772E3DD|nr:aspartyl-phosphate phosphatase Spo0E family protein [Syntrophomonas wolfei]MDD2510261.1 aspartyl-phosphate phosphatase Spo0E family protein [Syntrophomonas sp.]MDD3879684.1 aspartyl-phosphate phosphatase Spo0E family protein [Syntrophomonas sp.]
MAAPCAGKGNNIAGEDNRELIEWIELLRRRLETLAVLRQNYTDPEVLATSQALDEALNEFYYRSEAEGAQRVQSQVWQVKKAQKSAIG